MYPAFLNEGSDCFNNIICTNKDRNTIRTCTLSSYEETQLYELGTKCQLETSFKISWLQSVYVSWVSLYLIEYMQYLRSAARFKKF